MDNQQETKIIIIKQTTKKSKTKNKLKYNKIMK